MTKAASGIKVIFDTNIWISYLIGRELQFLSKLIADKRITIVLSKQLLKEIKEVTSREKISKYFKPEKVIELLKLLNLIGEMYSLTNIPLVCRDPKDNFLLALINKSKANYLITGDKDLLVLNPYQGTKIIDATEFREIINNYLFH